MCFVPDEDAAGRGVLLEPGGDVDGVAGDERLPGRRVPGDDLTGVHADAHLEPDASIAPEFLVQCGQPFAHLDASAHGPQRVVLVELGDPEHRHHGVPDVLLDGSAVTLDRPAHRLEVARLHVAQRLGIQALAERRRAGHVAEHDRDRLADLALARAGRQGGRASGTEGEAIGALATAVRTGQHRGEPTAGDISTLAVRSLTTTPTLSFECRLERPQREMRSEAGVPFVGPNVLTTHTEDRLLSSLKQGPPPSRSADRASCR